MFRLIPVLVLVALVIFGISWLRKLPPGHKRRAVLRILFVMLLGTLVFLVVTGRIHWVGAVLGALLPFIKTLAGLAMQFLPFWQKHRQSSSNPNSGNGRASSGPMSLDDALDTLGLGARYREGTLTREDVSEAHRRLMQKVHPDRGGNDYLAARVNEAKDCLLKHLKP
ncbi:molecular chaperone DnaJ [Gilvimarinus algae]|uniref:Molecular chaperone DnaJ n=1 Tax=Gilvimarinus algae TaxID=3058037 RepID=A0ABT8TDT5_9GAMM|nr:molecular chaperone DnaJ [Gilvimarinus sp. SDUM040014]MDO3382274.1 molecular chaperone DnaJ [Gilvimarinus sp. SDUM040014]